MNNVLSIVKLEYLLEKKHKKTSQKISDVIFCVLGNIILTTVFAFLFVYSFCIKNKIFNQENCFSFVLFILFLTIFLYCLTKQQKNIYMYKNKVLLHSMPIEKKDIFIGKMLKNLIDTYMFSLPMLFSATITMSIMFKASVLYSVLGLVITCIMPLLCYATSSLILMPIAYVFNILKNKHLLKLILAILATIVVFYVYSELVFGFAEVIFLRGAETSTVIESYMYIINFNGFVNAMLTDLIIAKQFDLITIVYIIAPILLTILSFFVGVKCYQKIFMRDILEETSSPKKIETKLLQSSPFKAYFVKELKDLFRSESYAYTYFGLASIMPLMVLFCGNFVLKLASKSIGSIIIFGTILLVIMVFCSVICCASSTFISKEGECFWILKTSPNIIKTALMSKALLGFVVAFSSVFVSLFLILCFGFISIGQALLILLVSTVFIVGLISMGLFININQPNLFLKNKENSFNMILQIMFSIIISFIVGYVSIILAFKLTFSQLVLIVIAIVFAFATTTIILLATLGKKILAKGEV